VLIAFGVLAIGLIDNLLRPLLVGKDTQMPDYVVLISTLGGLVLFGMSGFIIGPVIAALFIATWDLFAPPEREARSAKAPP
jgi:predicted PurR-regulated permease PerM